MQINIVHRNVPVTTEQKDWIERRVQFALGRFTGAVRDVSLVFKDINGDRGGEDKFCRISVSMISGGEITVEDKHLHVESVVSAIVDRAARSVSRQLDRRHDVHVTRDRTIKVDMGLRAD